MMTYDWEAYAIVADVGGTFARFCRVNLVSLVMDTVQIYPCAEFSNLDMALRAYQKQHHLESIQRIAIAIACPVTDDVIDMTNCHWHFSIEDLKRKLGLLELKVINDFSAVAMSLTVLNSEDLTQIGGGRLDKYKTKVVLGAGTGLGVAYLIPTKQGSIAIAGEGGHASWGATTEQEWFIYNYLKQKYTHVSQERLLSGQGLEAIYQAITAFNKEEVVPLKAAEIIAAVQNNHNLRAQAAVAQFLVCLGSVAGDLALTFGAFGGVYIAGGIVPRLLSFINDSDFRISFENKGRFREFNQQIPTYVITTEQPGLLGAAVYLQQSLVGETCDVVSNWERQPEEVLTSAGVIPVVVIKDLDKVMPLAEALFAGGIKVIEVTLRTPVALEAISMLSRTFPNALIGAGTVTNADQLLQAIDAGAKFALTPGLTRDLLLAGSKSTIPLIPGIASVSELMDGLDLGYTQFKFFPAIVSGGVAMLRALYSLFPQIRFCPTGGINAENYNDYLSLPNVSSVGGSWIAPENLIQKEDWSQIKKLCLSVRSDLMLPSD